MMKRVNMFMYSVLRNINNERWFMTDEMPVLLPRPFGPIWMENIII
jgi:hypothetical protein